MQINGVPNKYEIYQEYYLETNGKEISYTEALRLFYEMNYDERSEFEQYYKDETGYEIVDANGYSFGVNAQYKEAGTKKVKKNWKIQTEDGSFGGRQEEPTEKEVTVYTTNSKKAYIDIKYTIEGYAKEKGIVLDPVWSQYSAEEIIGMKNNGVNIPQEIVDIANTILQTTASNYEINEDDENTDSTETTEKEPFLELIPKAEKKIEECNETNEKIDEKINEIIPEQQKQEKDFAEKLKQQQNSLSEYENIINEWNKLQNKLNNGETLTETESNRYSELSESLGAKKDNDSYDFEIDKNEIAKSLNEINIIAVLGEKLGEETVEIGDTLADYTSQANYKTTYKTVAQSIGFLKTIMTLANGKNLAKEANEIGNNTLEYTQETNQSVNNIASTLGIENSITGKQEILESGDTANQEDNNAENASVTAPNENKENNEDEAKNETQDEKSFITDAYVKKLIDEGKNINADLYKQINIALSQIKTATKDSKTSAAIDKQISTLINEFIKEEEERQKEIEAKEQENEDAKNKLEEITGKSSKEIDKEIINNNNYNEENETNKYFDDKTKEDIEKYKTIIVNNNKDIQTIENESIQAKADFKENTTVEKKQLDSSLKSENEAFKINSEYQGKDLPEHNERMDFINDAGITLTKIGTTEILLGGKEVQIGQALLSSIITWQQGVAMIALGILTIAKGSVSIGVGASACKVSKDESLIEKAENTTNQAGTNTTKSLTDINNVNNKIISITGETNNEEAGNNATQNNNSETQTESTQNATNQETQATDTDTSNTENTQTPVTTQQIPLNNTITTETAVNTTNINETQDETPNQQSLQKINENPTSTSTKNVKEAIGNSNSKKTQETKSEEDSNKALETTSSASSKKSSSEKNDDEMTTDDAQSSVEDANSSAKDDSKESEQIKKDTDKTTKELEKETKQLTKLMKKDEKEIIKMTKESTEAAKKQEEALTEYETLVAENEKLIAEDENNQQNQANNQIAPQQNETEEGQTTLLGSAAMTIGNNTGNSNEDKIANNDQRINELGVTFNANGRIITSNRTKITRLQKTTKTRQTKFNKKTELIEEKNKEAEKKEQEKQKRLNKQLGAVGVAENVFQITLSTGLILSMNPFTAAAGAVMVKIGTYGIVTCGVTKSTINIANGNLTAGLMSLGQCAITLATSMTGTGAAAGGVLGAVSNGLNIVASSAELVNNVRATQGKDANGVFSKISTIAGVASSITSSAATLSNLGQKGASTFGKTMQIAGVAGSALSSTSQLMTEFGGESQAANILGMIGGAVSTAASLGMLADKKFNNASEKNKENQDKTKTQKETTDQNTEVKETDNQTKTDEKLIETEAKKAEQEAKKQAKTTNNKNNSETTKEEQKRKENNIMNEGASEEFADIDTDQLQQEMFAATDAGDTQRAKALALESTKRNFYKAEIAPQQKTENRQKNLSNTINAISGVANVASSLFSSNKEDQQQQKKKSAPAGKLTERTKEIIRKNQKRIAALAAKGYNL